MFVNVIVFKIDKVKKVLKFILGKILNHVNIFLPKKIGSIYFKIPIMAGIGLSNFKTHEVYLLELLKLIINDRNDILFVDVGANIGQTLLKLKSINKSIEYVGFEPNVKCNYYIEKLAKANSLTNTIVLPFGVSKTNGIGVLNFYNNNLDDSSASMVKNFRENNVISTSLVAALSISEISSTISFNNMEILKVDVEGMELEVIESFSEEIKRNQPYILLEILPVYNKVKNTDRYNRQENLQGKLKELQYTMFRINKSKMEFRGLKEITSIEVHGDLNLCDYIFVPKNKFAYFKNLMLSKSLLI